MSQTVLVVDDEADIRESLRDVLEDEGYAVALAENGHRGLEVLRCTPRPSAVILDMIMPVMGGDELYAAMKNDPELTDIPVLVSTSDPSSAPSGVLIMKKPINVQRLLKVLAALVR
jgi:CheY-like chemotaxis protein